MTDPSGQQPEYQQQGFQQPGFQQPGYQQPGYQQPGYQQPGYQQPGYQQPGYQQPAYQQYPNQPGYQQYPTQQPGYQQPGYQQYGYPQYGYPQQPAQRPGTLNAAVTLMFIGGGLEVLAFILDLAGHVRTTALGEVLVAACLWFLMAAMCLQGKQWARITSTVLFGLSCLALIVVLAAVHTLAGVGASSSAIAFLVGAAVFQWLIGLSALILLWLKATSAYFSAVSGLP